MNPFAPLPEPPYWAVIFASQQTTNSEGYDAVAQRMVALAAQMPGYLGIESTRDADGFGITISYWASEAAIDAWREQAEHRLAQTLGKSRWYERFTLRVCRVERAYGFVKQA